ncbi:MAG: hypothetical protein ACH346_02950 [Chthoniobacterales bacterium]
MNTAITHLFHGREDILFHAIENKSDALRFEPEKGLYSKQQGPLRAIGLTSPNEKTRAELDVAYDVLAGCIKASYGKEAALTFLNNFASQRDKQKPLTLAHVEAFLSPYYDKHLEIIESGIIMDDLSQAEALFEGAMKGGSPTDSQIYTSRRTISRAEIGAFVEKNPEEDEEGHYADVRIPMAAVFIHGKQVLSSIEEELKQFPNFREDFLLSERSPSPDSILSETTSEASSKISEKKAPSIGDFAEQQALSAIAKNGGDWNRFKLIIEDQPVVIHSSELDPKNPSSAANSLAQLKTALSRLSNRPISNREAFEIIRLIDKDGRTAGFPSGKNQASGIGFGTAPMEGSGSEKVEISFDSATETYDISRTSAPSYLKNIIIPEKITVREKIDGEYTNVQRPQVIEFLVAVDSNGDAANIKNETEHPELQRFKTSSTFTYRLTPPASDNSTGTVELVGSRQYYEPVVLAG